MIIDIKNLGNYFAGTWVHKHLDFSVQQGEIVAIVGGSGAGKTTLLRTILMLQQPRQGEVNVFGIDVMKASYKLRHQVQRRWGVLFQQSALFSSLTVLENVMFPMIEFTKLSKKLCIDMAMMKIAMAGLAPDVAYRYPDELSGGMKKRAALARALAMDPELLLLDEPTSGLDPKSASDFDQLILELRASLNLTIVMVSHDTDSLWAVADRVAFLGQQRVLAMSPMQELVHNPQPLIQEYFTSARMLAKQGVQNG